MLDAFITESRSTMMGTNRVLLVDDDALMRRAMRWVLTAEGFQVGECPDTETALLLAEKLDVDAVVFECNIAGRPVDDFVKVISERHPAAVLIGFCARRFYTRAWRLLNSGANAILETPDLHRDLVQTLREHISIRARIL